MEAIARAERRETGMAGGGENQPAGGFNAQFVDVDVAGHVRLARHKQPVVPAALDLARAENVVEAPDVRGAAEVDALVRGGNAGGARKAGGGEHRRGIGIPPGSFRPSLDDCAGYFGRLR